MSAFMLFSWFLMASFCIDRMACTILYVCVKLMASVTWTSNYYYNRSNRWVTMCFRLKQTVLRLNASNTELTRNGIENFYGTLLAYFHSHPHFSVVASPSGLVCVCFVSLFLFWFSSRFATAKLNLDLLLMCSNKCNTVTFTKTWSDYQIEFTLWKKIPITTTNRRVWSALDNKSINRQIHNFIFRCVCSFFSRFIWFLPSIFGSCAFSLRFSVEN